MNITIIGAGPVGCYTGYLLAKAGQQVTIYENHAEIGLPIQCTGILTADFEQFNIPLEDFLINTIEKIEVSSPSGKKFSVQQKDYIVCRKKFDNYFADLARKEGCQIFVNHSFMRKENDELIIKNNFLNKEIKINPNLVIAADGALSKTAKAYGFYHPTRQNYYGVQAVVSGDFAEKTTQTYFGKNVAPGSFIWVVPESKTKSRVGLFAIQDSKKYFDKFITENNFEVLEMQAGVIPIFNSRQVLKKSNCYLVGDASGYVKATTGGGIIPGFKQAEILVDCIVNNGNYNFKVGKLKRKMSLHLYLNKILGKFSDADWEKLIGYLDQQSIQQIFKKHTRDNPLPLVFKTVLTEPRLLYFLKHLF
jgi:digeranylgeranylglycerophospholipid reductase